MIVRFTILILLLASSLAAEVTLLKDFKGIDNKTSDFSVANNYFRELVNVDLDNGKIRKRPGYDSVSTVAGMDSIIAIYGAYYSDGTQQLFVITDTADFGYGGVYVTDLGSNDISSLTKVWSFWSVLGYPSITMVNDEVYIVNGYNRGIVYHDGIARSYPPRSPAEPFIVPLKQSGGLNGVYRYVFYISDATELDTIIDTTYDTTRYECAYWKNDYCVEWVETIDGEDSIAISDPIIDTTVGSGTGGLRQGVVSAPVRVNNGQVFLTGFTSPNVDSVNNYTSPYNSGFRVTVARTKGNFKRLTDRTEIFYVNDFLLLNEDSADNYVFIDSLADDDLDGSLGFALDLTMKGIDSTDVVHTRYGAPGYMSQVNFAYSDSADANSEDSSSWGLFYGIPEQEDTLGVAYFVTLVDTVTAIETDTSRGCYIWNDQSEFDGAAKMSAATISLPKILPDDSGLVYNVYRALIEQVTYDSSYWSTIGEIKNTSDVWRFLGDNSDTMRVVGFKTIQTWKEHLAVDTIVIRDLFMVGQFPASDTIVVDSIRYDSLVTQRRFTKGVSSPLINNIFTYDNRLNGVDGSKLAYTSPLGSLIDTIQSWGQTNYVFMDDNDGDYGTLAYPSRWGIRYFKFNKNYTIYDNYTKSEFYDDWGCIAPKSFCAGAGGNYYLSARGIIFESDGRDIERTFDAGLISDHISFFDNMSLGDKYYTYGFRNPYTRKAFFSVNDTAFVFHEDDNGWTIYTGLSFGSATMYSTETDVEFRPGDTMYFVKPGGSTLYRFGTSEYDNYQAGVDSTAIQILIKTVPVGYSKSKDRNRLSGVGLCVTGSDAGVSMASLLYNEEGTQLGSLTFDDLTKRYTLKEYNGYNPGVFYQLWFTPTIQDEHYNTTVIDNIELHWNFGEGKVRE